MATRMTALVIAGVRWIGIVIVAHDCRQNDEQRGDQHESRVVDGVRADSHTRKSTFIVRFRLEGAVVVFFLFVIWRLRFVNTGHTGRVAGQVR